MKILHLVLYSKSPVYDKMIEVTNLYYNKFKDVDTFYYCYDNTIVNEFEYKDNILYIKGSETWLGILSKTLSALKICFDNSYDYVIRSNCSTIVDFDNLKNILSSRNYNYAGFHIYDLQWIDPYSGIHDSKLFGLKYVSGTCIILSNQCARQLIDHSHLLDCKIVDDISIGLFLKNNCDIYPENLCVEVLHSAPLVNSRPKTIEDYEFINTLIEKRINEYSPVFYRNKSWKRGDDIHCMITIVSCLLMKK